MSEHTNKRGRGRERRQRERERETETETETERDRERIPSRLCAVSSEAQCRAQTHEP